MAAGLDPASGACWGRVGLEGRGSVWRCRRPARVSSQPPRGRRAIPLTVKGDRRLEREMATSRALCGCAGLESPQRGGRAVYWRPAAAGPGPSPEPRLGPGAGRFGLERFPGPAALTSLSPSAHRPLLALDPVLLAPQVAPSATPEALQCPGWPPGLRTQLPMRALCCFCPLEASSLKEGSGSHISLRNVAPGPGASGTKPASWLLPPGRHKAGQKGRAPSGVLQSSPAHRPAWEGCPATRHESRPDKGPGLRTGD